MPGEAASTRGCSWLAAWRWEVLTQPGFMQDRARGMGACHVHEDSVTSQ